MFDGKEDAPISIIITTLAAKSYEYCIRHFTYYNEYSLMIDTLKNMPLFIETKNTLHWIENPTVTGENFAEKWNYTPIKKQNFDLWHADITKLFESIHNIKGQHLIFESLKKGLGESPVNKVYNEMTHKVDDYRQRGLLGAGFGTLADSHPVKKNTFFGN
jgi:hypothetical protein